MVMFIHTSAVKFGGVIMSLSTSTRKFKCGIKLPFTLESKSINITNIYPTFVTCQALCCFTVTILVNFKNSEVGTIIILILKEAKA